MALAAVAVWGTRPGTGTAAAPVTAGTAALLAVVGLTWAYVAVAGTTVVSRLAPAADRGEVLGAYAALAALGGGAGSLLGGWLATRGFSTAFAGAALLVFAGAGVLLLARWRV
ncbi:MAG: hypothetical protein ABEJ42_05755 [Halobacteriaceae archaeon]